MDWWLISKRLASNSKCFSILFDNKNRLDRNQLCRNFHGLKVFQNETISNRFEMMIEEIPIIENSSDQNFSRTLSLTSYTFTTIILSISIILATPSNMMIIWLVFKTPFLRNKAVNMLIVNLCFLDLIASCLDMPLKWIIVHMNHHNDQYHKFICKW